MHHRRHLKKLIESFKGHFCGQMKMMSNWFGKPKIGFSIDPGFSLCIFFCPMLGILDDISKWSSRLHRYSLCGRMEMWNIGGKSLNDTKKKLTKKWTELQFSSTYLIRHYYLDGICIVAFRYLLHFCIKWVLRSYVILQKPPAIMHSVLKIKKSKNH